MHTQKMQFQFNKKINRKIMHFQVDVYSFKYK